jgi:hypothetical protein
MVGGLPVRLEYVNISSDGGPMACSTCLSDHPKHGICIEVSL